MAKQDERGENGHKEFAQWRVRTHQIIFGADTPEGKWFDIILLWAIIASVATVMLETVEHIAVDYGTTLFVLEWVFTILFTIEYIARIVSVVKPMKYMTSFMGLVDLLSILPTYIGLFVAGPQYLLVIRTIRLMRVFRVLKLSRYVSEGLVLKKALKASRAKITVFLGVVIALVIIMGTLMYLIEGPEHGYTSIPTSIYWTIVTITTVGYGDITPVTTLGQVIASLIMLMGYGIIAVPTGIVSAEMTSAKKEKMSNRSCGSCSLEGHAEDAKHCKYCGEELDVHTADF